MKELEINVTDKTVLYSYLIGMFWKTLFWPGFALISMYDIIFPKKEEV